MKTNSILTLAFLFSTFYFGSAQDYVTVYVDCDYRGSSHRLYDGDHRDNDLGVGNDRISSIRIPRGWSVTVYSDNNFRGRSRTFDESVACMPADLNDEISSIRVTRSRYSGGSSSGGGSGPITIYEDCNYRGDSHRIGLGTYNADDLGIGNDKISSIRVPRGYTVSVYTDNRQRGYMQILEENVSCFGSDLNDKISSIEVTRTGSSSNNRPSSSRPIGDGPGVSGYGPVTLYRDCNYRGTSMQVGEGTYFDEDLSRIGNDQLSAILVPRGWEITLYTDNNQRGYSRTYTSNVACLPLLLNDKVSSFEVRRVR